MSLLEDWDDTEENATSNLSVQSQLGYRDISERAQDILTATENDKIIDKESPIFSLDKVQYKPNGLKHLVVSSNILAMALNNSHVIRLNLKNPEDLEDIEISRRQEDQIHKLFLDPTGNHLIISMESEDNYYLHSKWKKPKVMSKLKGLVIESIAWNRSNGDTMNTREILIGTSKGKIYEASIEANEKAFMERLALVGQRDQTVRPVYNVDDNMPITGLRFERFAGSDAPKYFVMATTPTRIYQFIGGPTFDQLFSNYETNPGFHELPGELTRSELQFFSKYQGLPKSFAWLTGPGIYHGDLIFGSQNPGDSVMTDTTLLPYPSSNANDANVKTPIALLLSEFHFILLYPHKIQAISTLKKKVVWEEYFSKSQKLGEIRGLALDPIAKTAWLYSEYAVYEIIITKEDRNVWEMYLEKGQYEAALQYCKTPSQKDRVWSQQADYYFSTNNYKLAATYYGKSHKPFEEIALRFINIPDVNALKTYLLSKLENIKKANNATQVTLIATWLTEIYLDKLNQLRDNRLRTLMTDSTSPNNANLKDAHDALQEEFEQFLKDYKENLDKSTTYNLISSHGRIEDLLFYANLIEDFDTVIHHHIQRRDFLKALDVMARQPSEELFYKFSPTLMEEIPFYTVNCWIRADQLDPRKLIPALMRYNHSNNKEDPQTNQAIRYLQHCVKKLNNTDPVIHNYLLTLYAKDSDDAPLLKFLSQPERHFDEKYALRLCTKENKTTACVLIYSAMALYEEAVDLALKVDLELAKINADKPEDDDALRKKLWLKIARHVVEESNIKKAMELLNQCDLLKIEDILPFFPDFTRIDTFKDEICSSLEDYNRHIETLKVEMEEATKSANLIRKDIKELRNRYGYVSANSVCDVCDLPVLTREFYLFPCEHVFHADCLKSEMTRHLDNIQRGRVNELQQQIQQLSVHGGASLQSSQSIAQKRQPQTILTQTTGMQKDDENITVSVSVSKLEKLKDDLDDLIAGECLLCGDVIIKSIADPFIQPSEMLEIESWAV